MEEKTQPARSSGGFLQRMFCPVDHGRLEAEKEQAVRERDQWKERCEAAEKQVKQTQTRLETALKANGKFADQIIAAGFAKSKMNTPDDREFEKKAAAVDEEQTELPFEADEAEKKILRERAAIIAEQEVGEHYTDEDVDRVYQKMLEEPTRWLSDSHE